MSRSYCKKCCWLCVVRLNCCTADLMRGTAGGNSLSGKSLTKSCWISAHVLPFSSFSAFGCSRRWLLKTTAGGLGGFLSHVINAGCQCLVLVINCQQTKSYFQSPIFILFLFFFNIHTDYNNLYFVISLSGCRVTFN